MFPFSLVRSCTVLIQNHLDPPFENVSGGKERKLVCAAWRAGQRPNWRKATLGCFDDAFGVGLGFSARAERVIIAGHLSFHGQLPACVTRQRVEKEDGA